MRFEFEPACDKRFAMQIQVKLPVGLYSEGSEPIATRISILFIEGVGEPRGQDSLHEQKAIGSKNKTKHDRHGNVSLRTRS